MIELAESDVASLGKELVDSLISESSKDDLTTLGREFVTGILADFNQAELSTEAPIIDENLWEQCRQVIPSAPPPRLPYFCGTIDGDVEVWLVDGDQVKLESRDGKAKSNRGDEDFMDFTEGGNGVEDPGLCGKHVIYLDATIALPRIETLKYILYHEAHERRDMLTGLTYDQAHVRANAGEKILRERTNLSTDADLAVKDLASPPAEQVFDVAIARLHRLTRQAQAELLAAFQKGTFDDFERARAVIEKYQPDLVLSLTETELAATLAGMSRVAERLPSLLQTSHPLPKLEAVALPGSFSPALGELIDRVRRMPPAKQDEALAKLTPEKALFVKTEIAKPPEPPWTIPPAFGMPEEPIVRFPLIEHAARDLRFRRLLSRGEFDRLAADAREKAFTVARVETDATLAKIRDVLAKQVEVGPSLPDFREKVKAAVGEGTFLSPWHMELVYRQNVQSGYSKGMDAVLDHPMVVDAFPYESYVPIHDDRCRPDHRALEKLGIQGTNIYRRDDPVWKKFKPPWDFG